MSFKYYLSQRNKKFHVRLRYSYNKGSRQDFLIGIYITDKKHFNPNDIDTPIKKLDSDFDYKNRVLRDLKRSLEEIIDILRLNKKIPTAELVKERYNTLHSNRVLITDSELKVNQHFVVKVMEEYRKDANSRVKMGDGLRKSSYEKMDRILSKWEEFFEDKKLSAIQFEDLKTYQNLFKDFALWCLEDKNNFANSSINKYSTSFRSFLRWSYNKDYHNIDVSRFDSPSLQEVSNRSILALSPSQLKHIASFDKFNYLNEDGTQNADCFQYKDKNDRYFIVEDRFIYRKYIGDSIDLYDDTEKVKTYTSLEVYKDFFVFLCATSLAYIDAANLKITDFDYDKDCFILVRKKTSTPVMIPMNDMSRRIWMKYCKEKHYKTIDGRPRPTHYLFPRVKGDNFFTNQNCNDGLKVIGEHLKDKLSNMVNIEVRAGSGVKEGTEKEVPLYTKLHTHMGRKTFISFAFSEKISSIDIAKVTGHSNEKIMKHYVNTMRDEAKEEFHSMGSFVVDKDDVIGPRKRGKKNEKEVLIKEVENTSKSVKESLLELKSLLDEELITLSEYESKRTQILSKI
jgi:site-specific recombinase XerD